ncbi:SH3 domain-containing protein [Sphingomonas tagetis]|uniref:SH3 domain-containing protein n=1 Tax=Sphingomonas tagetis TaxID=2949092 RepID=UPI00345E0C08
MLAILLGLFLIGKCSSDRTETPANSTEAAVSSPAYVAARSLNCRREPDSSSAVSEGLSRDEQVTVAERRGDWARLSRAGGDCWVSSSFLVDAPGGGAAVEASTPSGARGLMSQGTASTAVAAGAGYVAGKAVRSSRSHAGPRRRGASRGRRGSGGGFQGSGCPCSGSQVCIGPRGGRYCITSGGNKRYGV